VGTEMLRWHRPDFQEPVGFLGEIRSTPRVREVGSERLEWVRVDVPVLVLGHRAALSLLQGISLSALLLPGHELRASEACVRDVFDVLLNVSPFRPYEAPPRLTGLVLGKIVRAPERVDQVLVLEALVRDALKALD
jgi:hypothetical protein